MINELLEKKQKLAVIGLGYVGLPIALEFAKKIKVVGFDINAHRIERLKKHIDPSQELSKESFDNADIYFTDNPEDLKDVRFFIVAVPTPIDEFKQPDLTPLLSATNTVGHALKKGDYVIYESTVYPGCTEEDCVPLLEKISGLNFIKDFKVGYSPERINPGDHVHTLQNVAKVVSGCDEESLKLIAALYELVVAAGIHQAPTIKVAEAAKIIENTQRDVNIALMNELSIIFDKMNINTFDVLDASGTKWNFLKFYPGLVGGHCIGVDPYYLTHKAAQLGYHSKVITSGRDINDSMGVHISQQIVKKIIAKGKNIREARILIMGATFKENVTDIRNSKVADLVNEFKSFAVSVDVTDPLANSEEVLHEYGFPIESNFKGPYDAVIVAVAHREYANLDENFFKFILHNNGIIADIKGTFRNRIKSLEYWSL